MIDVTDARPSLQQDLDALRRVHETLEQLYFEAARRGWLTTAEVQEDLRWRRLRSACRG